ncbi:hypothetical protein [Paractinoplanes deccanensis]|uniref:hypothetical protein n=1 Tax=Paractinoplanes deccanensis TaxID=113561 RepID=UPI001943B186|nr:hypothetical protein [Actinoplanes deccanensis]
MTTDRCEARAQQMYEQHRRQHDWPPLPDWDGLSVEAQNIWYRRAADELYPESAKERQ